MSAAWVMRHGEMWCNIHKKLTCDCDCLPIEDWATDPYTSGGPVGRGGSRPGAGRKRANGRTPMFTFNSTHAEIDRIDAALDAAVGPGSRREQILRLLQLPTPDPK